MERIWNPGDSPVLPDLPDEAYGPDSTPLDPPNYDPWEVYDVRTGRAASQAGFRSRESAERKIAFWAERQRKGGRPDISAEDVAALRVRRFDPNHH